MPPPRRLRLRPEIEESLRGREEPRPHQLSGFAWLGVMVSGGLAIREVPGEFWEAVESQGATQAKVKCYCGHASCLDIGAYPLQCRCQRAFFFDGTAVWALNTPSDPPSA